MKKNIFKITVFRSILIGIFLAILLGCPDFFNDGNLEELANSAAKITSLSFQRKEVTLKAGEIGYNSLIVSPFSLKNKITPTWKYDELKIKVEASANNAVITGLHEGQTSLIAEYEGHSAISIIKISGFSDDYLDNQEPYIYSSTSILQMSPNTTEKIFVSLHGGTAADIDRYTWTVDNPSTVSITPTGQYCQVQAKQEGYARIKVMHSKSSYPYYVGIYIFEENSDPTYITTTENIVTLYKDKGEKTIFVELQNPKNENFESQFNWSLVDDDGNVTITSNGKSAVLTPIKAGMCTLRATHPDATGGYPLDITVRVIEIIENVYIEPSETFVTLSGDTEKIITAKLVGIKEGSDYSVDDFTFEVSNTNMLSHYAIGNQITLGGLKNGSTDVIISHPKSEIKRQVLVVVEDQLEDAIDTSLYITTSQNYIKTKIGAEETELNILFKGGKAGDEKDFKWDVVQSSVSGGSDVISLKTTDGESTSIAARSISSADEYASGTAYIEPLSEGTATIILSHPKAYYKTEILVKVLPETAILEEPLYLSGSGIVRFLNSDEATYEVRLNGNTSPSDENNIEWEIDNSSIKVMSSGTEALLSSSATGSTIANMTLTHPRVDGEKKVLVLTADTQEELDSIKAFYADKMYYSINKGKSSNLYINSVGFGNYNEETKEYTPEDFKPIQWVSNNPSIATVEKNSNDALTGVVSGVGIGVAKITANYNNLASITFTVTVYPENVDIGAVEKTVYLTTSNNVVNIASVGKSKAANVTAIGMDFADVIGIQWESNNTTIASVIGNGDQVTITGVSEGETTVNVSHPKSENSLTIYVRIGSKYVVADTKPIIYISASSDVITLTKNSPVYELTSVLVNGGNNPANSFDFTIDDGNIATIEAQYRNGKCYIKPKVAGMAELTIRHPAATNDKKVLVIVGNTEEELALYKYISTSQNVVSVSEGGNRTISVSIKNVNNVILDGFTWMSEDRTIADVTETSASTAVITGNRIGTTRIKVTHNDCSYPLYIIVQIVDPIQTSANPYIQTNTSVLTLLKSQTWTTITADLVGGVESDALDFSWESSDSSILQVLGQSGTGKVRAIGVGTAYVTVRHQKAPYQSQILIIADDAPQTNCSISVAESIISMKPNASSKTINATLVGGDLTDKYNFRWSLDVYDVIELDYSANTAVIRPLQQGQATLTISHPKSAYDQQIIIKVSEYTQFDFSSSTKTMSKGKTSFISMQIPVTPLKTHVEYTSDSPRVATAQGTSAVCQITGLSVGTTIIRAKLVATNTNIIQANAEMLVSIEEGASSLVYISASTTIYTMEVGNNKTLSAVLTGSGVIPTDQHNLKWTSTDPSIVTLRGASSIGVVSGSQVYAEALKSGETTITVSHEKSSTNLIFYIIVPGSEEKTVSLNKTYVTIEKGSSTEIKAQIDGGKNDDYNSLTWSVDKLDGVDVVRLMGKSKTVSVYALSRGTATVRAQLPNGKYALCDVTVEDPKSFSFATQTVRVNPGKSKTINYTISPMTAGLQWVQSEDTYFMYTDNGNTSGNGQLTITGIKEGRSTLSVVTSYGNKAQLQVVCAWDYMFTVDKLSLQGEPDEVFEINIKMNPIDSDIIIVRGSNIADIVPVNNGDGTGKIIVTPTREGSGSIEVGVSNPAVTNTKETYATKTITLDFSYDSLTLIPSLITKNGFFSRLNNGILTIGDGEEVELGFSIAEKNVDWSADFSLQPVTETKNERFAGLSNNTTRIKHAEDHIEYEYFVPEWWTPVVRTTKLGGFTDRELDEKQSECFMTHSWPWGKHRYDHEVEIGGSRRYEVEYYEYRKIDEQTYTHANDSNEKLIFVRTPEKDGTILSIAEYESVNWWYCPGHHARSHGFGPWGGGNTNMLYPVSIPISDKSVRSVTYTDILEIVITHNSKTQNFKIPVYTELRSCPKNQQ